MAMRQNLRYDTYDLEPLFTEEQCQVAFLHDWSFALTCSENFAIANRFRDALASMGMFSRNFLNVLLHRVQNGYIMYDVRVLRIAVTDITDLQ